MTKQPTVYILASRPKGTLYTGLRATSSDECGNIGAASSKGLQNATGFIAWSTSKYTNT